MKCCCVLPSTSMEEQCDVGYSDYKKALPSDIQECIQGAQDRLWSFLPKANYNWLSKSDRWQPINNDLFQLFSDRNQTFSSLTNYDVAKRCIHKAMEEKFYQEAMDIIFVVDRYAYWKDKAESDDLLEQVRLIGTQCPEVYVAPQLILRKVRLLKDRGDYQGADKITNFVLSLSSTTSCHENESELAIGTWRFESRQEFLHTASLFLMLKGQIQMYLAQPVDAAIYFAASARLGYSTEHRVLSGGHSLQLLVDVLLDMGSSQKEELQKFLMFKNSPDMPLMKYFTENGDRILNSLLPGDIHFPKQIFRLIRIDLMRVFEAKQTDYKINNFHSILRHLNCCFQKNLEWAISEYRDVARDFAFSVFNVHLIFDFIGHASEDVLLLSKELFIKACGMSSEKDLEYFQREINKVRRMIGTVLGSDSHETQRQVNSADLDQYPMLRSCSPEDLLRAFKNPVSSQDLKTNDFVTNSDMEACLPTVDPVATTLVNSRLLPSNTEKFKPKLFQVAIEDSDQTSDLSCYSTSAQATVGEGTVYQSLLSKPMSIVNGFSAPQKAMKVIDQEVAPSICTKSHPVISQEVILETKLSKNTVYQANVANYFTVEDQWRYQKTLVFVHDELQLPQHKKGQMRDVIKLQYLHQNHFVPEAIYLGKRYRQETLLKTYHNDVIMHQLSLQSVARFNKKLASYPRFANRIRMVPVDHMEILDESGCILEVLNVEPFIQGKFTKMTNNHDKINSKVDTQLLLAFSHFTWCDSEGKFMVTDLQGWIPEDPRIPVILTDPAINSKHLDYLGITNMGSDGLKAFWTKQHPECNEICQLLGLERDSNITVVNQ